MFAAWTVMKEAPQAKASVFGRIPAEARGKAVSLSHPGTAWSGRHGNDALGRGPRCTTDHRGENQSSNTREVGESRRVAGDEGEEIDKDGEDSYTSIAILFITVHSYTEQNGCGLW